MILLKYVRIFYNALNGPTRSASNIPNESWHPYLKTAFPSVSATLWWSREMFHKYVFGYLNAADERE